MSKQRGPGFGAHILPAVPAGPTKTQHTDSRKSTNVAGAKENTERGQGRMMACGDNAAPIASVCLKLRLVIMEIPCSPVSVAA